MNGSRLPIVVIGLPRRCDRRVAIQAALSQIPSAEVHFAADNGAMVDWRDWTVNDVQQLRTTCFSWRYSESSNRWWARDLRLGEIACTLSHWNVWAFSVAQGFEHVIILEDDAKLQPEFASCEELLVALQQEDPGWALLYLGRGRVLPDRGRVGMFVVPGFSYGTFGYVVSRRGLLAMLETDLLNAIIPVDEFIPAMYLDHPRPDVRKRFPPRLAAYGLSSDVVLVTNSAVDSDTEDSPFLVPNPPR
jgi:collagen beta-1,O-galactosyltransferase